MSGRYRTDVPTDDASGPAIQPPPPKPTQEQLRAVAIPGMGHMTACECDYCNAGRVVLAWLEAGCPDPDADALRARVAELESHKDVLMAERDDAERDDAERKWAEAEKVRLRLEARIGALKAKVEVLRRSRRQWEAEWELAERNNTDRKAEVASLKAKVVELEQLAEARGAERDGWRNVHDALRIGHDETCRRHEQDREESRAIIAERNARIAELERQRADIRATRDAMVCCVNKTTNLLQDLAKERNVSEARIAELEAEVRGARADRDIARQQRDGAVR